MKHATIDSYGGGRLKVSVVEKGPSSTRHYTGHCQEHGGHELLEPKTVVVDRGGFEWVPKDDVDLVISYCEECIDEERSYDQQGDAPASVVADMIGTKWSREFREFFEPRDQAEGLELAHCPYCGSEFSIANPDDRRGTCPEHGPLRVDVKRLTGGGGGA